MFRFPRCLGLTAASLFALSTCATSAKGAIDPDGARKLFAEAQAICARDGGALWGRSLCGPMFIVDPNDRSVVANEADSAGALKHSGEVFVGVLPADVMVANTPTEWAGTRWTQLMWPFFPDDASHRHVTLAHELFHRIQPELGLMRPEGANGHLDTLEGRYLLQLEWRALAAALRASTASARRTAAADALLFRAERYRQFPKAAAEEAALETDEGVPEYTGVRLGLTSDAARIDYAVYDLSAYVSAPTFVRSFAYATGAAYGLLLDGSDPDWKDKVRAGATFDRLLAAAMRLQALPATRVADRAAAYDAGGVLRAVEVKREAERQARMAALRARLVDGPVLLLPLHRASYQFKPLTLQALDGYGTVYPTMRLASDWGSLEVEDGALLDPDMKRAWVSAVGMSASGLSGPGWKLELKPGWAVKPGARKGDFVVAPAP